MVRAGTDLVLVTHHLHDVVPEISRVILLKEGKASENLSAVFGRPITVTQNRGWYAATTA